MAKMLKTTIQVNLVHNPSEIGNTNPLQVKICCHQPWPTITAISWLPFMSFFTTVHAT